MHYLQRDICGRNRIGAVAIRLHTRLISFPFSIPNPNSTQKTNNSASEGLHQKEGKCHNFREIIVCPSFTFPLKVSYFLPRIITPFYQRKFLPHKSFEPAPPSTCLYASTENQTHLPPAPPPLEYSTRNPSYYIDIMCGVGSVTQDMRIRSGMKGNRLCFDGAYFCVGGAVRGHFGEI